MILQNATTLMGGQSLRADSGLEYKSCQLPDDTLWTSMPQLCRLGSTRLLSANLDDVSRGNKGCPTPIAAFSSTTWLPVPEECHKTQTFLCRPTFDPNRVLLLCLKT